VFKAHRLLYHSTLGLRIIRSSRGVEAGAMRGLRGSFWERCPPKQRVERLKAKVEPLLT